MHLKIQHLKWSEWDKRHHLSTGLTFLVGSSDGSPSCSPRCSNWFLQRSRCDLVCFPQASPSPRSHKSVKTPHRRARSRMTISGKTKENVEKLNAEGNMLWVECQSWCTILHIIKREGRRVGLARLSTISLLSSPRKSTWCTETRSLNIDQKNCTTIEIYEADAGRYDQSWMTAALITAFIHSIKSALFGRG